MLLLFNKTIKPLNQFAKKSKASPCFWGYCWQFFFTIFDKIFFPIFLPVTHKFLWILALRKVLENTLDKFFLAKTTNINYICHLAPFIVQNFKKNLYGEFWHKACFGKNINMVSCTSWPLSKCKILKIFSMDLEIWGCTIILGSKWLIYPNQGCFFLEKLLI